MSLEETIAAAVEAAVSRAVAPLTAELAALRATTERLYTVTEAAEHLRLGRRTVERMVATGEIPSTKVGARRLLKLRTVLPG